MALTPAIRETGRTFICVEKEKSEIPRQYRGRDKKKQALRACVGIGSSYREGLPHGMVMLIRSLCPHGHLPACLIQPH